MNDTEISDKELITAAIRGDQAAFRALFERYQSSIFRFVKAQNLTPADAQDIVQETFVKVYFSLATFRHESSFYTWVCRIARNMIIDLRRARRILPERMKSVEEGNGEETLVREPNVEYETPFFKYQEKEYAEKLESAFGELSEEQRTTLILREFDGLDYSAIASVLNISTGTVMSRLHYARKKLIEALQEDSSSSNDRGTVPSSARLKNGEGGIPSPKRAVPTLSLLKTNFS